MSVFGYPEKDLTQSPNFPNTLLETGHDILFFWVARMAMLSAALTDKPPFKTVLLHGLIRDADGKKMSKSSGNVIDPNFAINGATCQELKASLISGNLPKNKLKDAQTKQSKLYPKGIPECGSDGLRAVLCWMNAGFPKDIKLQVNEFKRFRGLIIKMLNASKFVKDIWTECNMDFLEKQHHNSYDTHSIPDLWIMQKCNDLIQSSFESFDNYDVGKVCEDFYNFFFNDLCNTFLEYTKYTKRIVSINILKDTLLKCMHVIHPVMPLITTHISANFGLDSKQLGNHLAKPFQLNNALNNETFIDHGKIYRFINYAFEIIENIRTIRLNFKIGRTQNPHIFVILRDDLFEQQCANFIKAMVWTDELFFVDCNDQRLRYTLQHSHVKRGNIVISLKDISDATLEDVEKKIALAKKKKDFLKLEILENVKII